MNTVALHKKQPYRAKRLGIYCTLGMQLCFYETVFAKESAISGRDRHVCSSHAGILFPLGYATIAISWKGHEIDVFSRLILIRSSSPFFCKELATGQI